jgi:hypothetical protein
MKTKLAFLAAVAAFVMPGLAMAQSSSTFPGSFTFAAGGPDVDFDLTLTCNGGTPLTQTVSVGADETVNFTVIGAADIAGTTCDMTISGLPESGWDLDDNDACEDIVPVADGAAPACLFTISPTPFGFWANITWDVNTNDVPVSGDVMLECASVWDGSMVTTFTSTQAAVEGLNLLPGTYAPHPDGSTVCMAELMVEDSAVEVNNSGCADVSVEVGDPFFFEAAGTEVIVCDIEATVFFEGIPTLSQYGMAIMVLLMLGVGFVGFRRFV